MPPKKADVKNLDEKQTPFEPVPYETADICTSITLLSSPEKDVVIRALWILSKYCEIKDDNVEFLYKSGIIPNILELIVYSDLTVLRFTLKIIGQLALLVPAAAKELSLEQYHTNIKQINHIFMTITDEFVLEFSTQILSQTVKDQSMTSFVFKAGVIVTIFNVLQTNEDPDIQYNTLIFLNNVIEASDAIYVLPHTTEFSAKIITCYLKHKIPEIRDAALNIIEKLTLWKSETMQQLLKEESVVEKLFKVILNAEFKGMHKKAFSVIHTCMDCVATASYFVKSLEFIQFCQFAKTCPKNYILPSAVIITALTRLVELRQLLFDFSIEDTVLSFFRINNELVFYKTCQAISNMTAHRYCCEKMLTPVVMECLIDMLNRTSVAIIPYHEIALKTMHDFMKRDGRTIKLILVCRGVDPLTKCWLRDKKEYTHEGVSTLMDMLYIFSADEEFRRVMMNSMIYEMLLNTFDDASDFSRKALLVLNQYVDNSECRQYFIEFGGPEIVLKQIQSTPTEKTLKDVLIFLQRMFLYKKVGKAFLWVGCLETLNSICDEVKEAIPLINEIISMIYELYLPIKFYKLGRLEVTDHLTSRFHLINGNWRGDFPFLEILMKQQVCPITFIYVVDFSANVAELTQKQIKLPTPPPTPTPSSSAFVQRRRSSQKRTSILKTGSGSKTQKLSIQMNNFSSNAVLEEQSEKVLTCQVPPPINSGFISEDPYLPKYLEKLKLLIYNNKRYVMCFQHQVKLVAQFVNDLLSGPENIETSKSNHCLNLHLQTLREKLGTSVIPIGYLRSGNHCERALLFKALGEKVSIPCSLVNGRIEGQNNLLYWNEVPIINEQSYGNVDDDEDEQKTYLAYAVVDLVDKIGELMLVGSLEANKYCGLYVDSGEINGTNAIEIESELDLDEFNL